MPIGINNVTIITNDKFDSDPFTVLKSTEDPDFPATNVQVSGVKREWRSTGDASATPEWVGFDFGSVNFPSLTFLTGHNIPSTAVITIEGSTTATFTVVDTSQAMTWHGKNLVLFTGIGFGPTRRYWRVKVDTSGGGPSADGYVKYGRLIMLLGASFAEITEPNNENPTRELIDLSRFTESIDAVQYHMKRDKIWRFSNLLWAMCNDTTKGEIETIREQAGTTDPLIVILDPINELQNSALYGRIERPGISIQRQLVGKWNIFPFSILEAL